MKKKLYVLVRADLPRSARAVQAGHAVAQFLIDHPDSGWGNGVLVYLRVENEVELDYWMTKFFGKTWSCFIEEDLGNQLTAMAAIGVDKMVKKLPLL